LCVQHFSANFPVGNSSDLSTAWRCRPSPHIPRRPGQVVGAGPVASGQEHLGVTDSLFRERCNSGLFTERPRALKTCAIVPGPALRQDVDRRRRAGRVNAVSPRERVSEDVNYPRRGCVAGADRRQGQRTAAIGGRLTVIGCPPTLADCGGHGGLHRPPTAAVAARPWPQQQQQPHLRLVVGVDR